MKIHPHVAQQMLAQALMRGASRPTYGHHAAHPVHHTPAAPPMDPRILHTANWLAGEVRNG